MIGLSDSTAAGAMYAEHFERLVAIARERFALPDDEAEAVAHDVLMAALWRPQRIGDVRAWLDGAVSAAAARDRCGSHL